MSKSKDCPHFADIHCYKINETIRGSVAIYNLKDAYEANIAFMQEHHPNSISERGIEMIHDAHGESHVEFCHGVALP